MAARALTVARQAPSVASVELKLYSSLLPWYRVLTPVEDYADEAQSYLEALQHNIEGPAENLLELGAGAGHNAYYLKPHFRCTLTDLSPGMLALSQELNPECEHLVGDMRTLRLGRTYDAVFVHDAIAYMLTEVDLRAAMETAFVHLRPGGAAVFAPDLYADTFVEQCQLLEGEAGDRALKGIEWAWRPDPNRSVVMVEYNFLLRRGVEVQTVHDRHEEGLFARGTWLQLLNEVGFRPGWFDRPLDDGGYDQVLYARKPR